MKFKKEKWFLAGLLLFVGIFYFVGLQWGLPSTERRNLVISSALQTPEFYQDLIEARKYHSDRFGEKNVARCHQKKEFHIQLLHSISSFILRSNDGDEQLTFVTLSRLNPFKGKWDPVYHGYGNPYLFAMGGTLLMGKLLGGLRLVPDIAFYYSHPEKMAEIFLWGRLFSVASGLLCVFFFYRLARRFLSPPMALFSSLLFGLTPINLYLSHVGKPHLLASAFALWAVANCLDLMEKPGWKNYLKTGALFGLAVGTTINMWPLVLFLLICHLCIQSGSIKEKFTDKRIWAAMVFSVIVYFLVNPLSVININGWLKELTYQSDHRPLTFHWNGLTNIVVNSLFRGAGISLIILSVLGMGLHRFRHISKFEKPTLIFLGVYLFLLILQLGEYSEGTSHSVRYFVPMVALLGIWAGLCVSSLGYRSRITAYSIAGFFLILSVAHSTAAVINYKNDTPLNANNIRTGTWINKNIKKGSTIGVHKNLLVDFHPPFRFLDYDIFIPGNTITPMSLPTYFIVSANPTLTSSPGSPLLPFPEFYSFYDLEKDFVVPTPWFYTEYFGSANFSFWIYRRKAELEG